MDIFWPALLKILLVQFIIGAVIIFILFWLLERQLVESALHKLEVAHFQEEDAAQYPLTITTAGDLSKKMKDRVSQTIFKKTGKAASIQHVVDKRIIGGIIITLHNSIVDHSMRHCLKEGGFLK